MANTPTRVPSRPMVFGKSSIVIQFEGEEEAFEFADAVESSTLDMPENFADWAPVSGVAQRVATASPCTFTPTFAQDLTTGSLFLFLLNNRGKEAQITNKPNSMKEGRCSFKATLGRPTSFGGNATGIATATASLPLIGDPDFTPNAAE